MRKLALVFVLSGACGSAPPCEGAYPYADGVCAQATNTLQLQDALTAVRAFYGTRMPAPQLVAYEKGDCDAVVDNKTVPQGRIFLSTGACVYGSWFPRENAIYMTTTNWKATIAHELLHQKLFDAYGDDDAKHLRGEWSTWVPAAVAMLDGQW